MQESRNYSTISPSAKALLLMKAHTTIPFAREAAALIQYPERFEPDFANHPAGFWLRVMHFESRYWSINQLLPPDITNILEISSGFSFRGLTLAAERPVYYIDTDLPEVIATKQRLVDALTGSQQSDPMRVDASGTGASQNAAAQDGASIEDAPETSASESGASQDAAAQNGASPIGASGTAGSETSTSKTGGNPVDAPQSSTPLRGHYQLLPLNALDGPAFFDIVHSFPSGPLLIVNEGLLVYLGVEEKRQLCKQIREALLERGGYWITADVYLKRDLPADPELEKGDILKKFLEQHNVKENMFNSFEEAEAFFASEGLIIDKEFEPDYASLTSLPHFLASASPELLQRLRSNGPMKVHTTWRLKPAP